MKNLNKFFFLLLLCLVVVYKSPNAQNLALNKSYIFSTLPNYEYSDRSHDNTSLTDGIYTSGNFWRSSTTVGWQSQKDVTITIDLKKTEPIGIVTFNTVRDIKSNINFPQNIFVFISDDNVSFKYVGDAADTTDNLPGNNEVRKFILNNINQSARYVLLKIIPHGSYIFCDEIEVLQGKKVNNSTKDLISINSLMQVTDSLKVLGYMHKAISKAVEKLESLQDTKSDRTAKEFTEYSTILNNKNLSKNELEIVKSNVAKRHANNLREKFNSPFILEKYNPWDIPNEFLEPKENASVLNYQFLVAKDDVQYGSFMIINSDVTPQKISFKVSTNTSINNIELYKVAYIQSSNYTLIPDPLLKIDDYTTIDPGVSEMFLFKITGNKIGSTNSAITISSNEKKATVNIGTQVLGLFTNNKIEGLNVNVWAYLTNPMLKDHKEEVAEDLKLHHVNTMVIPPAILPNMETVDFNNFTSYLSNLKGVKNILLMCNSIVNRRNGYKGAQFMSDEWKKSFIQWYGTMKKLIDENGFPDSQIYLYPYDEVQANNIGDFKNLILWAKKAIPGVKFYATLNEKVAIDSILPLVDIAQIIPSLGGMDKLPPHQCDVWVYSGYTPSRALSAYGYYRLMAWDAFVNDYKGIGFWNYADERNGNALNLISGGLPNPAGSYSVIYNDTTGNIISSRRWEAFKLGIEDYEILEVYKNKFGVQKAKELAQKVISDPSNTSLADIAKMEMLKAL